MKAFCGELYIYDMPCILRALLLDFKENKDILTSQAKGNAEY